MPGRPEEPSFVHSLGFYLGDRKSYVEFSLRAWYNVVFLDGKTRETKGILARVSKIDTDREYRGVFVFRDLDNEPTTIHEANILSATLRVREEKDDPWTF